MAPIPSEAAFCGNRVIFQQLFISKEKQETLGQENNESHEGKCSVEPLSPVQAEAERAGPRAQAGATLELSQRGQCARDQDSGQPWDHTRQRRTPGRPPTPCKKIEVAEEAAAETTVTPGIKLVVSPFPILPLKYFSGYPIT